MVSQIVVNTVYLVLLLAGAFLLQKASRKKDRSLSEVLKATSLGTHSQCASVIDQLRLAMAKLETKDSALLQAMTDAVTGQLRIQRTANLQNVCTSCDDGGCSPEAMDWVATNCVNGQYVDPGQIVPPQVTVPSAVPTPPTFVRFTATDWFGKTNCCFTVRWSAVDAGVQPVLKIIRPTGADVVIDSLTSLQREYTYITPLITETVDYKVVLGAKAMYANAPQDIVWDTPNMKTAAMAPSSAAGPPVARVEQAFTHTSVRFVYAQPAAGKTVVLQLNQGKQMDESSPITVPVENTAPLSVVEHELTQLTPFTWYTYRFGVREGNSVTWGQPAAVRTKPLPNPGISISQTGTGLTSLSIGWQSIASDYQARFYFAKGAIQSVAGSGLVVGTTTSYTPSEALEMGTVYMGVLRIKKTWLDSGIPATLPALRTYTVESESIVWATTTSPPTIPFNRVTFQVTDRTFSVNWNHTMPTGYRPMVIFAQGTQLPIPTDSPAIPYSSSYDAALSRANTIMEADDSWFEAYSLDPDTPYTAGLALTDGNVILLHQMPKQTLRTFAATSSFYPVIQSVTPSSTTNSSSMRIRWYTSTLTEEVKSKLDIGLIRVFPNPSDTSNSAMNNTASISLEKNQVTGLTSANAGDPAGYTSAVMSVKPYPGEKYTFTMMYYFDGRTPTTSAPRSQRAQYWKLTPPAPNMGLAVTRMVREAGTASNVLVTLGWQVPSLPLPAECGPLTHGTVQVNDNTPVSILNRDPATQVLQSILTTTTFTVQPNSVNTFKLELANNKGADKIFGTVANVAVPPIPALPTVTAYPMAYSIALGISAPSGSTVSTDGLSVVMATNVSGTSDRLRLSRVGGGAISFVTANRAVLTGLSPGTAYTVKEASETDTLNELSRLSSEATVTSTTLQPITMTAAPTLVSAAVDRSTPPASAQRLLPSVATEPWPPTVPTVNMTINWSSGLPSGPAASEYSMALEMINRNTARTYSVPVTGTEVTVNNGDAGALWQATIRTTRKVVVGGVVVADTAGAAGPYLTFVSPFHNTLNIRQTGATASSITLAWDAATVPAQGAAVFVVRLKLEFDGGSVAKVLTRAETTAGSITLDALNSNVKELRNGASLLTVFSGQCTVTAGRFLDGDGTLGHWDAPINAGVASAIAVEKFTLTPSTTALDQLTVTIAAAVVPPNIVPWVKIAAVNVNQAMTLTGTNWQFVRTGLTPSFTATSFDVTSSVSTYSVEIAMGYSGATAPASAFVAKTVTMNAITEPAVKPIPNYRFDSMFSECSLGKTRMRLILRASETADWKIMSALVTYLGIPNTSADLCTTASSIRQNVSIDLTPTGYILCDRSTAAPANDLTVNTVMQHKTYPTITFQYYYKSIFVPNYTINNVFTSVVPAPQPVFALKFQTPQTVPSNSLLWPGRADNNNGNFQKLVVYYNYDNNGAKGSNPQYKMVGTVELSVRVKFSDYDGAMTETFGTKFSLIEKSTPRQGYNNAMVWGTYDMGWNSFQFDVGGAGSQVQLPTGTRIRVTLQNVNRIYNDVRSEISQYEGMLLADGVWTNPGVATFDPSGTPTAVSTAPVPEFYDTDGTLSYTASRSFCTAKGMRLCSNTEVCTNGEPVGGIKPQDLWVPTNNEDNCWVSVGTVDTGNRLCKTHHASLGVKPGWGTTSQVGAWRNKVLCCPNN